MPGKDIRFSRKIWKVNILLFLVLYIFAPYSSCTLRVHTFLWKFIEQGCQREVIKKEELHFVPNLMVNITELPLPFNIAIFILVN